MIRINVLALLFVFSSCSNKKLHNEYIFNEPLTGWYVIVNGCQDAGDFLLDGKRTFVFPKDGILLTNIEDFHFTKNDVFFVDGKPFDPNSQDVSSYKLCYQTSSLKAGYNVEYLAKERGILLDNIVAQQEFDLYFFRVGTTCETKAEELDDFFDRICIYLLEHKVFSAKAKLDN